MLQMSSIVYYVVIGFLYDCPFLLSARAAYWPYGIRGFLGFAPRVFTEYRHLDTRSRKVGGKYVDVKLV